MDWLYEGELTVYLLLALVAGVFVALAWRNRKRSLYFIAAAVLALLPAYLLLDVLVETRFEQIKRKLAAMAAAVQAKNPAGISQHLASSFNVSGMDRERFMGFVENALRSDGVTSLEVWSERMLDSQGGVAFLAKPKGRWPGADTAAHYRVRGRFVREGNEWRLESFEVFNPFVDGNSPLQIPQIGR